MAKSNANTKKATPVAPASPEEPATNAATDEAVTAQDNPACQDTAPDADQTETNCEAGTPASPEEPATNPATDEAVTAQDNPACQDPVTDTPLSHTGNHPDTSTPETHAEGCTLQEDTLSKLVVCSARLQPGTYYQDCVDADKVTVMSSVINGVLAGRGSARDDINNEHYRQRLVDNAELVADEVIRRCTYSRKVEPMCSGLDSDLNS